MENKDPTLEQILTEHKEHLAIIVIDMQEHFMKDKKKSDIDEKVAYQQKVLKYAKQHNIPVVFLEHTHVTEDLGETIPELKSVASDYENVETFKKAGMDCFLATPLTEYIKNQNIKYLFFMGCNTEACVRKTIRTALKKGYKAYTFKEVLLSEGSSEERMNRGLQWFEKYNHGILHYQEDINQTFK